MRNKIRTEINPQRIAVQFVSETAPRPVRGVRGDAGAAVPGRTAGTSRYMARSPRPTASRSAPPAGHPAGRAPGVDAARGARAGDGAHASCAGSCRPKAPSPHPDARTPT
ncbi:hypothetical protein EVAR_77841_1 [Eumeta japonica]|uniref:Uncharacterized protein n=1 Tax=Eumeta variegata TaxID=151549 RepID=A0A4C1TB42_EUMVA|nr:hypothetical protein EVAR_77841_1 [Eumeta japonica]